MADYHLYCQDILLGTLTSAADDFPWRNGSFDPTREFEEFRPLFDRELALLNADRMDEWESAWEAIATLRMRLEPVTAGPAVHEFLLHIDGQKAWWRY